MKKSIVREKLIITMDNLCFVYAVLGILIILVLHSSVSFFPVLFLFDFCLLLGHPLFLCFVLKKKLSVCRENIYLRLKYMLVPTVIMESIVFLCYPEETLYILQTGFYIL